MKYLLSIILVFITMGAFGQNESDAQDVKYTLQEMFKLCEAEQDIQLAKYLIYKGDDESRKWKDVANPNETDEYLYAKIIRLKIQKQFLPYKYEFVNFHSETESEGTWYVWEMKYNKNDEDKKMFFAFLKINGAFALGDID